MNNGGKVTTVMQFKYTDTYICSKLIIDCVYHAICTIISIFIFRWNLLWYPVAFVVADILESILFGIFSYFWRTCYWSKLSLTEQLENVKEMRQTLRKYSPDIEYLYDLNCDVRYFLNDLVVELEEAVEIEKEKPNNVSMEVQAYTEELELFESSVESIKTEDNAEFLNDLTMKLNKVISLVSEKPATSVFANKIFNIYLPETIVLIKNMPKEDNVILDYKENLFNVCKEIDNLTETTIKSILNFNQKSTDIAFDVLMKDIRKTEEDLNNGQFD